MTPLKIHQGQFKLQLSTVQWENIIAQITAVLLAVLEMLIKQFTWNHYR